MSQGKPKVFVLSAVYDFRSEITDTLENYFDDPLTAIDRW